MSKMGSVQGIRALLGPSDEDLVIRILNTGAGPNDVLRAIYYFEVVDFDEGQLRSVMGAKAYQVYKILQSEQDRDE